MPQKAYRRVIPFYLSYDKPCGKLALGQNCIKIISDKSNSVATFLRIQTDIHVYDRGNNRVLIAMGEKGGTITK